MKITKSQLRRLIQEAMYSPVGAMSAAKEKIAQKSAEASEESGEEIDYLQKAMKLTRSDDEVSQRQGTQLLDDIGEFSSPGVRGIPTPELEYTSTKNPEKTGTIQNRIPGGITDDSELAMREFVGDIEQDIVNTVTNVIYLPLINKLNLNDMEAFFSTPQWKEVEAVWQDNYIDAVAGEEAFGIGFDTSGDRYPTDEMDIKPYELMLDLYGDLLDSDEGFNLIELLEDIDGHFASYGKDYFDEVAKSYDYDPEKEQTQSYGWYVFYDLANFFKQVKREIDDGFHNAIHDLEDAGVIYTVSDRFIVYDAEMYDKSIFSKKLG